MTLAGRYEGEAKDGGRQPQLSAVGPSERSTLPATTPGRVPVSGQERGVRAVSQGDGQTARPLALQGVRVPSRNATVRRRVVDLYRECSWLTSADLPASVRWATLTEKFRRLSQFLDRLPEGGTVRAVKGDAVPYKVLETLLRLNGELVRLEAALGITAAARASLGVDIGRMKRLGQADQGDGLPEADVRELEQRIVARLSEGQQPPQGGQDGQEGAGGV